MESGSIMRFIGRFCMEESPVRVVVKGWAARIPGSGAAIAGIECAGGSGQAVQSFAPYGNSILLVFDIDAQAAETADGGQAVRALEKIGNFGFPFGQSAEHDRAVRDGFIAGNGNFPFQAFDVVEFHG